MAVSESDKNNLTAAQQTQIQAATDAYNKAYAAGDTAGMNAAHAQAEAVRASAGYSGGSDGSGYYSISSDGGNTNYYSTGGTTQNVDYSTLINNAILSRADADTIRGLVGQRDAKINADPSLEQYRYDDTYRRALDYIAAQEKQNNSLVELEAQLQSLYAQNGALDQAAEAERQAKIAAVEAAIGRLNTQKGDLNNSYDALQRQLYIDREKNKKNIQQQMAAAGLTGGAAESTLLGLNTAYEEGLRQGEQERVRAIGEIEQGITDTQLTGNLDAAETLANRTKERLDSYAQALQVLMQQETTRQQQEKEDRVAAQNRAYALALSMLESGVMPSSDMLTTAGLDVGTAQQIKAAADAEKTVPTYQGATPKAQKPTKDQFEFAVQAAAQGNTDDVVRQIIESYMGVPMETVLATYGYSVPTGNPINEGNGPVALGGDTSGTELGNAVYSNVVSQVRSALLSGDADTAEQFLERYGGTLSTAQKNNISAMLAQYGIQYDW